jgi:Spy/CpxP family protein refolding chaperone
MLTERKYRLLLWVTIFSVVLNLSLLGTVAFHLWQGNAKASSHPLPGRGARFEEQMPRMFKNRFDLNPEQQQLFRQHHREFRELAAQLAEEMSKVREQMMEELLSEKPDTLRLNQFSQQIGELHAKLKKISYVFYLELKEDCPPEQIQQLNEMFMGLLQSGQPSLPVEGRKRKGKMRMKGVDELDRTE